MTISARSITLSAVAACTCLSLAACSGGAGESEESAAWRQASSAEANGGMDALIAAAQAEGEFNAMGLYDDWANYGGILKAFSEKYGIEINNDVSSGASQDLINAVVNRAGQDDTLDYLDVGLSFGEQAAADGLLAEYAVSTQDSIPAELISDSKTWYHHIGGIMAIGCDAQAVEKCPTSWEELNDPAYEGMVAINGDPTTGESGFMTVFAASLANGGSLDDIQPGIDYFAELSEKNILLPVAGSQGTIETGETPIYITWDYLLAPLVEPLSNAGVDLEINYPSDGTVSSHYTASINEDAAHPAVARLFMEFLFSDEGQNLLMEGYVRPARFDDMQERGVLNEEAAANLPDASGIDAPQPTLKQRESQQPVLAENWAVQVG